MREGDDLDVERRQLGDGTLRLGHVVAEELAGERQAPAQDMQHIADEEQLQGRRVEADASRRVARGVDDTQPAETRDDLPVQDRMRILWTAGDQRDERG